MSTKAAVKQVYDVFARVKRGEILSHIGAVEAETEQLAKFYADFIYDEESWAEMCMVPRNRIIPVKLVDTLFSGGGKTAHV